MKSARTKELILIALIQFFIVGAFFLTLRHRLGPLYQAVLIEPSGLLQQRPWMFFNGEQLKQGSFPLWNPHTGFGQPHLANLQTAVFYPLNFVVYALGPKFGFELWLFLRLWLGGFFLYLFLSRLKLEILPSLAGSLIWPLGGYGLWCMQLVELNSQILLPVFLIGWHNLAERPRLKPFLLIALIGWLIILGGHPEAIFNSWLFAGLYFIFRLFQKKFTGKEKIRRIALAISAAVVSGSLASLVLLPFFNYLPRCWSMHYPGFGLLHLDIKTLPSLVFPFGKFASRNNLLNIRLLEQGLGELFKSDYTQSAVPGVMPGIGVVCAFLVMIGLFNLKRTKPDFSFFSLILILLLGLAYGIAPFHWLALIPPFSHLSNYKFYYSEMFLCLSIISALGIKLLLSRRSFTGGIFALALMMELLINSFSVKPYLDLGLKNLDQSEWLQQMIKDKNRNLFRAAFLGDPNPLPPNLGMLYGINDLSSSDALYPEAYVRRMDAFNDIDEMQRSLYFYPAYYYRPLRDKIFSYFAGSGIKYALLRKDDFHLPDENVYQLKEYGDLILISNKPEAVALNNLYYPGWRVFGNGAEQKILTGAEGWRASRTEKGENQMVDKFMPYDFRVGLWVSLVSFIMMGVFRILRRVDVKKD